MVTAVPNENKVLGWIKTRYFELFAGTYIIALNVLKLFYTLWTKIINSSFNILQILMTLKRFIWKQNKFKLILKRIQL